MAKVYTRTGDDGTTGLFGGDRVAKHHTRIAAYGTVDETNSVIGVALSYVEDVADSEILVKMLTRVQDELFILGADLATEADAQTPVPRITEGHIDQLESDIDQLSTELAPLKNFVLPGGHPTAAHLHHARTVCRRAERETVNASEETEIRSEAIRYLNRLSDFLFVAARYVNAMAGHTEPVWEAPQDNE